MTDTTASDSTASDGTASVTAFARAVPALFARIPVEGVDTAGLRLDEGSGADGADTGIALDLLEDLGLIGRDGDSRVFRTEG